MRVTCLLLDLAGGRHLSAADPAGKLALVLAALVIGDQCGDAVGAAYRRLEGAGYRLVLRAQAAVLDIGFYFLPGAALVFPFQAGGPDFNRPVSHGVAVQVGDDKIHLERRAALDENTVAAQADVQVWPDAPASWWCPTRPGG